MPHDIIDRSTHLFGDVQHQYWRSDIGWQITTPLWVESSSGRFYRSKSTNNPILPSGGRAPADWLAFGGWTDTRSSQIDASNYNWSWYFDRYSGQFNVAYGRLGDVQAWDLGNIPVLNPNSESDAIRNALAKFTKERVQLEAFAKELSSTFRMAGDLAGGMARSLDHLMQGNFKSIGRMANWRKLPSKYLEWLYGWKPLADDVSNAFEAILGQTQSDGFSVGFRLRAKVESSDQRQYTFGILQGHPGARVTVRITELSRANFRFVLPSWYFDELPPVAPFGSIYETTPYSFVLDWFIPIGDWIGAVESAQLWPFFDIGTVSTQRNRNLISYVLENTSSYEFKGPRAVPTSSKNLDYWYERRVIRSQAEAILMARPNLRNPLSLSHAAQGLALLTQVFNKWK